MQVRHVARRLQTGDGDEGHDEPADGPPDAGEAQLWNIERIAEHDHFAGTPITSVPAGGEKLTSEAETLALRSARSKMSVAVWPNLSCRIIRRSSLPENPSNASRK